MRKTRYTEEKMVSILRETDRGTNASESGSNREK
jgi:hypothetical protein